MGHDKMCWLPLTMGLLLIASPAVAQRRIIDHGEQYRACMALVAKDPAGAFESGQSWHVQGGGIPARHCVAMALIRLKQPGEGAKRLEGLAEDARLSHPQLVPEMLAQAAQAWLMVGETARALAVQSAALQLRPDDIELRIDRALTLAEAGKYADAAEDLTQVLKLDPRRSDALVFRASAYRYLDKLDQARADLEQALKLKPDHPAALLERGMVRRLRDDKDGARQDWLAVLRLSPDGPTAEAARANLERLDLRVP